MQEYRNATVVVVSDCMGKPLTEQSFSGQAIRVAEAKTSTETGVDGHLSAYGLPQEVMWLRRQDKLPEDTTQVLINSESGALVTSGELSTNRQQESSAGGLRFWLSPVA